MASTARQYLKFALLEFGRRILSFRRLRGGLCGSASANRGEGVGNSKNQVLHDGGKQPSQQHVAYGNPVYLTNATAMPQSNSTVASFNIAGGTNYVPYDILTSTNLASSVSNWTWLGFGYTSNRYTFSNQPLAHAFYILAKPHKTMVVGWGDDTVGQCDVPYGISNAVMVAGGGGQSLALINDGTVVAWGQNAYGQASVPTNLARATMVACGWYHDLALLTNGTVAAWGLDGAGLGYHLTEVPTNATNVSVISAQALHSLALTTNGAVIAWGYGPDGEASVPSGLSNVVAISAGFQFNVVAMSNGTVAAWGNNSIGQCNYPAGLSNVVDVEAGPYHTLALLNNSTVVAWGDGSVGETNVPVGLTNVVAIAAGGDPIDNTAYSLALRSDGTVFAWGNGPPVGAVQGMSNVFTIAAGADHALAVRTGPRSPVITLEPADQYQLPGGNVTFTSKGSGVYGVAYQWQFDSANITGATNATLTLTNVQAAQQGTFNLLVSNEVGSILSSNADLHLVNVPAINAKTLPTNQTVYYQGNLMLNVSASAPGEFNGFPLGYQWQFNGSNISGATTNSYVIAADTGSSGSYSVIVTNAAGTTNVAWQVGINYGTLGYYLATNILSYTNGYTGSYSDMLIWTNWSYALYAGTNLALLTNAMWSPGFWLHNVTGLSATALGYSNGLAAQTLLTMVSPRHYLFATHTHPEGALVAFLDTNNIIYWRTTLQRSDVACDTSVGILNADLPASVGFLPVGPTNFSSYLPTNSSSIVQGIGMNQGAQIFSQPMIFGYPPYVVWNSSSAVPFGLGTNWNVTVRGGDSSDPAMFVIGNQLVLVSHNLTSISGPNYGLQINAINQNMHYLSTNNSVGSDYQLTTFALTNWPTLR